MNKRPLSDKLRIKAGKLAGLLLSVLLAALCLAGCGGSGTEEKEERIRIVTTIFPQYDWVRAILGDDPAGAELILLQDTSVDLHSFQPAAADLLAISSCDLFIYIGGESDEWVENALKDSRNPGRIAISLLDELGGAAKKEELPEGAGESGQEEGEESEYDEHIWLSLRNASLCVKSIADALCRIDPQHGETYRSNAQAYQEKLRSLDQAYEMAASEGRVSALLFGDRFPFRYLAEDYGLTCYAAFSGCSAETEASFETILFLAEKTDELGLRAVMTIEGTDHRIAETIVQNTKTKDQKILVMDSMQAVTAKDAGNGTTYLSIMEKNLAVLKEALQ
ncbi:MAG: zinc ABC transporter substrate-binding protein [Lachnospiraceae bacterium]|nr:zinc ABC transporter substrate-binding protein [Lachnospiraceae bacterium]